MDINKMHGRGLFTWNDGRRSEREWINYKINVALLVCNFVFIKIILVLNNRLKLFTLFDIDKRDHISNATVEFYSNIINKFIIFAPSVDPSEHKNS